jgi:MFS family permease
MKNKRVGILAWSLCGVAIVGSLIQLALWATRLSGPPILFDVVEAVGWGLAMPVVFSILAALIIARQPGNRVGWLMMIVALALNTPVELIVGLIQVPPETMTFGLWLLFWLSGWSWIPVIFPVFLIPLYFPTGHLPSPRWKWVSRLAIGLWILFMLLGAFITQTGPVNADWTVANPVGFIPYEVINGPYLIAWGIGLMTVLGASVVSLFMRYRRGASLERQQIRWLLVAGGFFLLVYGLTYFASDLWLDSGWQNPLFVLSILGMPVAIAIAIFRYRLWDLDVVINRALIYGPLTTLLAGTFAMVIALTSELTKEALGDQSRALSAAVSAVVVAVIFQPLRSRIEKGVDTRFYPTKEGLATGLVEVQPEYWAFLDQATLTRITMAHVCRVLGTPQAAFFLEQPSGLFELADQVDGSAGETRTLTFTEKQRSELEGKRVIAANGPGLLVAHVPVFVDRGKANEVRALLSIGARANGKGYSGDDLKGLAELGGKVGLALNAVQLGAASTPG